jgi:hypothetical protein
MFVTRPFSLDLLTLPDYRRKMLGTNKHRYRSLTRSSPSKPLAKQKEHDTYCTFSMRGTVRLSEKRIVKRAAAAHCSRAKCQVVGVHSTTAGRQAEQSWIKLPFDSRGSH